jgi:predicted choloylglycine hydrolase
VPLAQLTLKTDKTQSILDSSRQLSNDRFNHLKQAQMQNYNTISARSLHSSTHRRADSQKDLTETFNRLYKNTYKQRAKHE